MSYYAQKTRRSSNTGFRNRSSAGFSRRSSGSRRGPAKSYIHPSKFVQAARPKTAIAYEPQFTFADFEMEELLKRNLETRGYTTPSPIQDQSIPHGLNGKDVVGIANTGTGKTIAFGLPLMHRLMTDATAKALVIAPTRELAQQIEDELKVIARGSRIHGAILIGGSSMGLQLRDLKFNPRVVVGTPGRIKDHVQRGSLDLATFNTVVLDEVDRMLDMGFIADIREILQQLQPDRQSFFFSATLDNKVEAIINTFSKDPIVVSVKTGETSDNVEQDIVAYQTEDEKLQQLHNLLASDEVVKALVFDETQRSVERLHKTLESRGFKSDAIHGGKSQGQRTRALDKFKKSHVKILVATDVAARGIDVSDITHVINYTQPQAYEDYVHRIGRAGRAGRTGYAFTFVKA